ncbi:cbb3-type cytochrome oxidase assembly protein CcoS [Polynucleobacter kasalickyi]|uniref:Cytochrome oxidase maturation protein, cbb3-type n=1 Tax=Polynucleobacter kasalickyi TaxID=1938817 RepID=A0A1W1ZHZ6_9BURK|nr:cbb3-type cytochrome oxidase assembly protein CcoS [Polynucleobacter kasalickyi]SMC47996.1 cytochrome oxidase maturation protein, cbb3-type [Polynucleobacter kasalickyi]
MESLFLLIPMSLLLVGFIVLVLYWSIRNGQFDDLEGPAYEILMDDDTHHESSPSIKK